LKVDVTPRSFSVAGFGINDVEISSSSARELFNNIIERRHKFIRNFGGKRLGRWSIRRRRRKRRWEDNVKAKVK
jgi:hypothetical protein